MVAISINNPLATKLKDMMRLGTLQYDKEMITKHNIL